MSVNLTFSKDSMTGIGCVAALVGLCVLGYKGIKKLDEEEKIRRKEFEEFREQWFEDWDTPTNLITKAIVKNDSFDDNLKFDGVRAMKTLIPPIERATNMSDFMTAWTKLYELCHSVSSDDECLNAINLKVFIAEVDDQRAALTEKREESRRQQELEMERRFQKDVVNALSNIGKSTNNIYVSNNNKEEETE